MSPEDTRTEEGKAEGEVAGENAFNEIPPFLFLATPCAWHAGDTGDCPLPSLLYPIGRDGGELEAGICLLEAQNLQVNILL